MAKTTADPIADAERALIAAKKAEGEAAEKLRIITEAPGQHTPEERAAAVHAVEYAGDVVRATVVQLQAAHTAARTANLHAARQRFLDAQPTEDQWEAATAAAREAKANLEALTNRQNDALRELLRMQAAAGIAERTEPSPENAGLSWRVAITGDQFATVDNIEYQPARLHPDLSVVRPVRDTSEGRKHIEAVRERAFAEMAAEDEKRTNV